MTGAANGSSAESVASIMKNASGGDPTITIIIFARSNG